MKTNKEIATLFSNGKFKEVADTLAGDIEWNIYENDMSLKGKEAVLVFCKKIAEYFESVTTKFEMSGIVEENSKVSIYGYAEFIKEGKTVSKVNSCDVYEFDDSSKIKNIFSYCNTCKPIE